MIEFKGLEFAPDFTAKSQKQLDNAQDYIDSEVIKRLEDYTPIADHKYPNWGKMSRSHKVETRGVIINTEPKARREYYINKGFSSKDGHNRGKFWLERMKADHKDDILRGVKGK